VQKAGCGARSFIYVRFNENLTHFAQKNKEDRAALFIFTVEMGYMRKQHIFLIQSSWQTVLPLAQQAGELFYKKLFASEPLVRHLFKSDLKEQAGKFTAMLSYIIDNLEREEMITRDIYKLGQRHSGYGAQPEHYEVVGESLLTTMAEGMGSAWTKELQEAWQEMLNWLFEEMIRGQGNYFLRSK
jgi:hemoglobin-like flavoprotein